ncbi:hypothetical protein LINPERHAP1_LOCUS25246, partial [Linum perenne]
MRGRNGGVESHDVPFVPNRDASIRKCYFRHIKSRMMSGEVGSSLFLSYLWVTGLVWMMLLLGYKTFWFVFFNDLW